MFFVSAALSYYSLQNNLASNGDRRPQAIALTIVVFIITLSLAIFSIMGFRKKILPNKITNNMRIVGLICLVGIIGELIVVVMYILFLIYGLRGAQIAP